MGADRSNADDPRWVTPWGRLLLRDMLDAAQHDTADRYADLLVEMRRSEGLGRPWPSGALGERGRLAKRCAEVGESAERELSLLVLAEEAATRLRRLGRQTERALTRMVREHADPDPDELEGIRAGLSCLSALFVENEA